MDRPPIRLLIIDDSAYNRKTIAQFFDEYPEVTIVGKATDGQEGLQMALNERPTVITLDLEMPRLDGFSFLRLLMANQPTPVIVISSHAEKENVFRALELGALDFVAKPSHKISPEIKEIKDAVIHKVRFAGKYNLDALQNLSSSAPQTGLHYIPMLDTSPKSKLNESRYAKKIVVIGASTGGPASISQIVRALPPDLNAGVVVAQHMPPRFTTTFAQRLNKLSRLTVVEMHEHDTIKKGYVYVAPGDSDLELSKNAKGIAIRCLPPDPSSRYIPSVDRLFTSAARAVGDNLQAIILTGMGDDGARGAVLVHNNGGRVLVESEDTAVVNGMPLSVIETGIPVTTRPLHMIANQIIKFSK